MAIQWFPGHMHLTKKVIAERIKNIDVVIEMLDARLPGSSANPMLAELTKSKPTLKVLNKQDLADPAITQLWLDYYNSVANTRAMGLDASVKAPVNALAKLCFNLAPNRGGMVKPMRVLICGIPNVGKSTLINTLTGKRSAKTGDEAGITKREQRISLANDFYLYDTPGILWPRIIVSQSGFNLAASGAIGRNAFNEDEVALELLNNLKRSYPNELKGRYKLSGDVSEVNDEDLLEAIGRKRGTLQGMKTVNLQKAAEIVIYDFRAAALGRITLESPEQYAQWMLEGEKIDAQRQLKKDLIERNRLIKFKKIPRPLAE